MTEQDTIDVAVLGASGYTGAELIRLLVHHPRVRLAALGAHAQAGQPLGDVYPHLALYDLPPLKPIQDIAVDGLDLVFCALPHATSQEIIRTLPPTLRVIDLSADFRLDDPAVYAAWYGGPHQAPALQREVAYGLTEHAREMIRSKRIIACPGCYPTAALLGLIPLLRAGMVDADDIVIDAKSGVTGAGRSVKQQNLFSEVADSLSPYGVGRHRHMPEIEQELAKAAGRDTLQISFTPHLSPMNRGELLTVYLKLGKGQAVADLRQALETAYTDEPFVHVLPEGRVPSTRDVRGSNHCLINVFEDRIASRAILISTIDNLVKGSSGQAIQNMNVAYGWPETLSLEQAPLFP